MESNNLDKDKNLEVQPKNENIDSNRNFVEKVIENKVIQQQPTNNIINLKKEIFDHRKLVRWTSFFGIFPIILFIIASILLYSSFYNYSIVATWINDNLNILNSYQETSNVGHLSVMVNGTNYLIPINNTFNILNHYILNFGILEYSAIFLYGIGLVWCLFSWIFNIVLLCKLKTTRKIYLGFFIFSFVIPFLTWLYCMGLMAFMKHNNRINYYEWLKEIRIKKYTNKQNYLKHLR